MKQPNIWRHYSYLIIGVGLAIMMGGAVTFALVSSLRHLLWLETMPSHRLVPVWLWVTIGFLTLILLVFWYRIISTILSYRETQRRLNRYLFPRLQPFTDPVPDDLQLVAQWFVMNDDHLHQTFTWGLLHPRIVISQKLWASLDPAAQKAVLYHEAAHAMFFDPLQQVVLQIVAFALQPLGMGSLYRRYLLHREIVADGFAVSACAGDDTPLLSALLIAADSHASQVSDVGLLSALEARIYFLETHQLPPWRGPELKFHLISSSGVVLLVLGQGLLVWCH